MKRVILGCIILCLLPTIACANNADVNYKEISRMIENYQKKSADGLILPDGNIGSQMAVPYAAGEEGNATLGELIQKDSDIATAQGLDNGYALDNQYDKEYADLLYDTLNSLDILNKNLQYDIDITYFSENLFSCVVEIKGANGITVVPYTYDLKSKEPVKLSAYFSSNNTAWKSIIPDIITKQALDRGMILLCDVLPLKDNHPYYILDGKIVILYRPYEITTAEWGSPRFVLETDALSGCFSGAYGIGDE